MLRSVEQAGTACRASTLRFARFSVLPRAARVSEVAVAQRAGSGEKAALFTEFPSGQATHEITGVCDAAGCQELISPGSIVSVFGLFAVRTVTADSLPLSFHLDGFSVTFNGLPGALFGVFFREDFGALSDQANVQAPWELDVSSGEVEVRVHWETEAGTVSSNPFMVSAAQASPGIFMVGTRAIVTNFSLGQIRKRVDEWETKDLRCNDGSPYACYISPGVGSEAHNWLFF